MSRGGKGEEEEEEKEGEEEEEEEGKRRRRKRRKVNSLRVCAGIQYCKQLSRLIHLHQDDR